MEETGERLDSGLSQFQHMCIRSVTPSSHVLVMTPARVETFTGFVDVFRP